MRTWRNLVDAPVSGTGSSECGFESLRPHQNCLCGGNGRRARLKPAFSGVLVRSRPGTPNRLRGWRKGRRKALKTASADPCRFESCAAHQTGRFLLPSPSGSRHHAYTVAFSLVRIRPGVRVGSSAVAALSRHGRGRRFKPVRTHHQFPLVAQWQSNRLISDRRVFDSRREDQHWRSDYAYPIQTGAARRRNDLRDGSGALNLTGDGADF
jgi:hypothetical protein